MTQYAPPVTIRDRLLSEAVRRREVSARAVPAIQDLLQHGLSFEQALVGTGLISTALFERWMTDASGLSLLKPTSEAPVLPPGLELETVLAWKIVVQKTDAKHWTVGLSNPWDTEIRSALEVLAVEHGWNLTFAYVQPSVADGWLQVADQARRSSEALARYARSLIARVDREKQLTLISAGQAAHPRIATTPVPVAWFPALHARLVRRAAHTGLEVTPTGTHRQRQLHLKTKHADASPALLEHEGEHPVRDWTDAFQTFFETGKLVFLLDERGDVLGGWPEAHVAQETEEWRAGKRWLAPSDATRQEELFHLALAGYPGTICFRSLPELQAWERAADQAHVSYAACIGQPTNHGIAWSLYTV